MGWARLPVDKGAVNSRPASELAPGEFIRASGCRYSPGSKQLVSDMVWVDTDIQPSTYWTDMSFGPFHLSFESTNDWLCMVVSTQTAGGQIWFALADGSGAWVLNSYTLTDNYRRTADGGAAVTAARIAHWGDRYYLVTDQGVAKITPPTGTGPPTATNLGLKVAHPDNSPMIKMTGTSATGAVTWTSGIAGTVTNLLTDDNVSVYITEYDSVNAVESAPMYYGRGNVSLTSEFGRDYVSFYTYTDDDGGFDITFPSVFKNATSTHFRAYMKYWGISDAVYDLGGIAGQANQAAENGVAVVGLSNLTTEDGESEFALSQVLSVEKIDKAAVFNPLPVLGLDGARLIFRSQRAPSTATAATFWNDSLVMNDAGASASFLGENYDMSSATTVLKYSTPGEPFNHPVPYFLNFASDKEDDIRGLLAVNDRLVVLCDNAVHTVRYLPFNNLLASQQGRVKDVITTSVGCPSTKGYTKVETSGGEFVVWVSHRGLEWSNGSGWADACPDFDMPPDADYPNAVLHNNAELYRLELYLGLELYTFYYHPDHMKGQALKMLGPTPLTSRVTGACSYRDKAWRMEGGVLKVTDSTAPPADALAITGHITGDNPFVDVEIFDIGVTHPSIDSTVTVFCYGAVRGNEAAQAKPTVVPNPELDETSSTGVSQRGNWILIELRVTDSMADWSLGPLWLKGEEESGANG